MRIVFAGTPAFAVPCLRGLATEHQLVGVLSQPDRPRGRGRHLTPSPVKTLALELAVPLSQPVQLRDAQAIAVIEAWRPDAIVVVAYGLLLPPAVLALPAYGCVNVHASLLPRWRGAAPIQRAILAGDSVTGVSIMQMEAGLDTGPVLLQRRLALPRGTTAGELEASLADLGATALLEALRQIAAGTARPEAQSSEGVTYAAKITKAETLIDWANPAAQIERQVLAFNPRPGAAMSLGGESVRVLAARALEGTERGDPGLVLEARHDALVIACGSGRLALQALQRPGRNPVSARELAAACGILPGQRLGVGVPR